MTPGQTFLRGPRLILRDLAPADLDAVHSFTSDPTVVQWSTWGPNSLAETRSFIMEAAAEPGLPDRTGFTLAVVLGDQVVGTAAVWTTSAADRTGELGYTLRRDVWGQGVGTEAAGLLQAMPSAPWAWSGWKRPAIPGTPVRCGCWRRTVSSWRAGCAGISG